MITSVFFMSILFNNLNAMVPITLWFGAAWGAFNCHDGKGICLGLLKAKDEVSGKFNLLEPEIG